VDPPPAVPLPDAGSLLASYARRPGDRHELVELCPRAATAVELAAAGVGIAVDVAAALLLELAWLTNRLTALDGADVIGLLDERACCAQRVQRRLTAAEADYLRSLMMARPRAPASSLRNCVAVPVRLLGRVDQDALASAAAQLERAASWEAAAVVVRVSMSEWALAEALARASGDIH
jgi:hypothetical protein